MFAGIYYCRARLVIQRRPGVIFIRRCTGSDQTPREPSRCPREPLALETAPRSAPPPPFLRSKIFPPRSVNRPPPPPPFLSSYYFNVSSLLDLEPSQILSPATPSYECIHIYIYVYTRYNVKSYSLSDSPREERAVFVPPKGIPRICR